MHSASKLKAKYRATGLDSEDRLPLLQAIREAHEPIELAGLLYLWGRSFDEEPEVFAVCRKFIVTPVAGVTATCLKLICDIWGHWQEYEHELGRYLDPSIYDEWYDEVIVAYSFVTRHPYGWSRETLARYATVQCEAVSLGLDDFA